MWVKKFDQYSSGRLCVMMLTSLLGLPPPSPYAAQNHPERRKHFSATFVAS